MNFHFNDFNHFSIQHAFPSCRTPAPNNYPKKFYPHEPCSYYSNPYHCYSNCPSWGRVSSFSYEQINTSFSSSGFDLNSNFYNSDWSNQSDFSWQAHAT
jgi:hypothetical protein